MLAQIPSPVPAINVQQTAVDFGTIDAGQTGQQTIAITNTGTAPLEITGIESDVSGLTFEPSMFTLSPDSSKTVRLRFQVRQRVRFRVISRFRAMTRIVRCIPYPFL